MILKRQMLLTIFGGALFYTAFVMAVVVASDTQLNAAMLYTTPTVQPITPDPLVTPVPFGGDCTLQAFDFGPDRQMNLRFEPDWGATIVHIANQNDVLRAMARSGDWYLVQVPTNSHATAWIHQSLAAIEPGKYEGCANLPELPYDGTIDVGHHPPSDSTCVLRTEQDVRGLRVTVFVSPVAGFGAIAYPYEVQATGVYEDWYRVQHNGYIGWARNARLMTEGDCDSLPVVEPASMPPLPTPEASDGCYVHVFHEAVDFGGTVSYMMANSDDIRDIIKPGTVAPAWSYDLASRRYQVAVPDGLVGWVDAEHVTTNSLCDGVPAPTAMPNPTPVP